MDGVVVEGTCPGSPPNSRPPPLRARAVRNPPRQVLLLGWAGQGGAERGRSGQGRMFWEGSAEQALPYGLQLVHGVVVPGHFVRHARQCVRE
ncbi:hypothetical protein ANANG_G00305280, partial [Anguilla anguilla]